MSILSECERITGLRNDICQKLNEAGLMSHTEATLSECATAIQNMPFIKELTQDEYDTLESRGAVNENTYYFIIEVSE